MRGSVSIPIGVVDSQVSQKANIHFFGFRFPLLAGKVVCLEHIQNTTFAPPICNQSGIHYHLSYVRTPTSS